MTTKFNQRTQISEDNEKKTISHTRFPTKKQTVGTTRREARFKEEPRKKRKKSSNRLSFCLLNRIFVNNIGIIYKFTSFKSQANARTLTRKLMDFAYDFKFCFLISKRI
jgi:hypothetical protein